MLDELVPAGSALLPLQTYGALMMDRAAIEAIVTKWEKWAAREMWIAEHLHPRAKTALVTELCEAFAADYLNRENLKAKTDAIEWIGDRKRPGRPRKDEANA